MRRRSPTEPRSVLRDRLKGGCAPGARPEVGPTHRRVESAGVVAQGVAEGLGECLLTAPQACQIDVRIGERPWARALPWGADQVCERRIAPIDAFQVDPNGLLMPCHEGKRIAIG